MEEAEGQLPERKDTESVLSISENGEERVPSPLPTEKPQDAPSVPVDTSRPPSPSMAPNGNEHDLVKNSPSLPYNKSKACKKKKKCLSDIFGHIVSGSKDSSAITNITEQFQTTTCTLKEEPTDSPYADLESVPILHRPKRTLASTLHNIERLVKKEEGLTKAKTKLTEKVNPSPDPCDSSLILTKGSPPRDTHSEQALVSCHELLHSSTEKHSMNLPASSRLMTTALRAEEETDLKDALNTNQISTDAHADYSLDNTPSDAPIKTERSPNWESPSNALLSTNHSSPKRRARKPDKKQIRNGSLLKSMRVDSGVPTVQPVQVKTETPDLSSSTSPSSTLSPMDAFQDVKELMFKSLVKEDNSDSEQTAFRPDSNYKFSTFLMLLKDMHDTREQEGKPLALPPVPVVIKEEPLVIPTSTGGDLKGSCDGKTRAIKTENGRSGKSTTAKSTAGRGKNRTKPIMCADTYHCGLFPIRSQTGNSDKQRRKQRLPAKLNLSIPGLSSDLADLAYGREFVSGHADLADPGSCPLAAADPSASYLDKNSGSTVAPKKRWQMLEGAAESTGEVRCEASAEMNGSYHMSASPDIDLGVEKQAENDSLFFLETSGAAGRTQTAAV